MYQVVSIVVLLIHNIDNRLFSLSRKLMDLAVVLRHHGCFKTEIKNETSSNSWENLTK